MWQQRVFGALVLAVAGGLALSARPAAAQEGCLEFVPPPLFDTSGLPWDDPSVERSRGVAMLEWGGHRYLVHSTGNDLEIIPIDDPSVPGPSVSSSFQVPPYGDRDYNLFNFSVCDDCRYGAAGFDAQGLVLWDFGAAASPQFAAGRRYPESGSIGAFTFSFDGQQYLIATVSSECQGDALVTLDGIDPGDLGFVQCITDAAGSPTIADGGFWLPDTLPGDDVVGTIYLVDSPLVQMYSVRVEGDHPRLTPEGAVISASWLHGRGIDLDLDPPPPYPPMALTSSFIASQLWDLSDPLAPQLLLSWHPDPYYVMNTVAIEYPYMWLGAYGTPGGGSTYTFFVGSSEPLDPDFWSPDNPWNQYPGSGNVEGVFTPDGRWFFLSRNSVLERFRFDCGAWFGPLFADDFESGTTVAWSATVP